MDGCGEKNGNGNPQYSLRLSDDDARYLKAAAKVENLKFATWKRKTVMDRAEKVLGMNKEEWLKRNPKP